MGKITAKIDGMHCSSCEVLIERKLSKLEWVKKVKVNTANETLEVECDEKIGLEDLQNAIKDDNYFLSDTGIKSDKEAGYISLDKYVGIGTILLIILALYIILKKFDFLPKNFGIAENMKIIKG